MSPVERSVLDPANSSTTSEERTSLNGQAGTAVVTEPVVAPRIGNFRWVICALLFFAATINYIDRQVIGILKPTLQADIHFSEIEYSWIVFAFQCAYAIGMLAVGAVMDRIGTRKGFSLSIVIWSLAAM